MLQPIDRFVRITQNESEWSNLIQRTPINRNESAATLLAACELGDIEPPPQPPRAPLGCEKRAAKRALSDG